ncbi:zinc metalloprotease HtpX [Methylogaea oryzae]|uniref:Zn-dependent protease n=1 Tax=Methylogaea oryzae TaxID=1295382 RepID=A0A8D4VM72_9GAMM|nr:zinc metalloprotease HtpX [Methylogaea oryzae]BBL70072.1 Zn-dependent protease [Methylogaea oryzae]
MRTGTWLRHAWINRLQTLLLILFLLGLLAVVGMLLWGTDGVWMLLAAGAAALLLQLAVAPWLVLRLYGARRLDYGQAPALFDLVRELSRRAQLPVPPALYWVDSAMSNAFAVGNRGSAAIALSSGLLGQLNLRELAGVLAHEVAHIKNGDIRVMGLADSLSRMTGLLSLIGQVLLLVNLPLLLLGELGLNWLALLLLMFAPQLAMLAQLGLSRVREFHADLDAAALTGDPQGLALGLAKIEVAQRGWRRWLLPGWGSPEPSWLRTHPSTEERIQRLASLVQEEYEPWHERFDPPRFAFAVPVRRPRYRIGGVWY